MSGLRGGNAVDWDQDQLDPDNWLRIPDFGVMPSDVEFEGFTWAIVTPGSSNLLARHESIRSLVGLVRAKIRTQFSSMLEIRLAFIRVLDAVAPANGQKPDDAEIEALTYADICAYFFTEVMHDLESATNDFHDSDNPTKADNAAVRLGNAAVTIAQWMGGDAEALTHHLKQKATAMAEKNKVNASKPTPKARQIDHTTVLAAFKRLVQEGHTDREARGLLIERGDCGSQSTVQRITNRKNEK